MRGSGCDNNSTLLPGANKVAHKLARVCFDNNSSVFWASDPLHGGGGRRGRRHPRHGGNPLLYGRLHRLHHQSLPLPRLLLPLPAVGVLHLPALQVKRPLGVGHLLRLFLLRLPFLLRGRVCHPGGMVLSRCHGSRRDLGSTGGNGGSGRRRGSGSVCYGG
jgi:hypothetical protein